VPVVSGTDFSLTRKFTSKNQNMKNRLKLAVAIAAMGLALPVFASASRPESQSVPPALKLPLQAGFKIEKQFKAEGGLLGWILSQGANKNIVAFTSEDGTVAISGNMINSKGENLTDKYLEQYAPKPNYGKFLSRLENSAYIEEGATGSEVKAVFYVFNDPNCGYCRLAWKAFQPYEKVGLQVRWVPVAFLAPDSLNKAAGLLSALKPSDALKELHEGGSAAFTGLSKVSPELRDKLVANKRLMDEMGFRGTPATIYKGRNGDLQAIDGMPKLAQIAAMAGLPEQPQLDPALAKYH
jgi:thiol:disulfide interchange protein DsbG